MPTFYSSLQLLKSNSSDSGGYVKYSPINRTDKTTPFCGKCKHVREEKEREREREREIDREREREREREIDRERERDR